MEPTLADLFISPDEADAKRREKQRAASRKWYSSLSPEKRAEYSRAKCEYHKERWRNMTPEKKAESYAAHYARALVTRSSPEGRAAYLAAKKEYQQRKKEKRLSDPLLAADDKRKERERYKRRRAKMTDADRAKETERHRKWKEANPDKVRASAEKRRAALGANPRSKSGAASALFVLQRKRCAICRKSIVKGFHIDHIVPLANGGTNEWRNKQLLCETCNLRKHANDPIEFMQEQGRLL